MPTRCRLIRPYPPHPTPTPPAPRHATQPNPSPQVLKTLEADPGIAQSVSIKGQHLAFTFLSQHNKAMYVRRAVQTYNGLFSDLKPFLASLGDNLEGGAWVGGGGGGQGRVQEGVLPALAGGVGGVGVWWLRVGSAAPVISSCMHLRCLASGRPGQGCTWQQRYPAVPLLPVYTCLCCFFSALMTTCPLLLQWTSGWSSRLTRFLLLPPAPLPCAPHAIPPFLPYRCTAALRLPELMEAMKQYLDKQPKGG